MAEKRTIELEVKSNVEESNQSLKSLKAQLKELKAQLATLDEGTDEFKNLARQAGELQDKIGDVNQQVKNFASDTRNLDVALQGVEAATGAFSVLEGSMALVGIESEDLQKTMVKLQAVMTLTNGVQSVANALNKDSALTQGLNAAATKIATVAQTVYTAVVGTSTGALKAFRIALATTGIGAIVVLLGFAAKAMGLFGEKTEDEEKAQKKLELQTKQLEKTIESYNIATNKVIQTIDNATRSELALAKQRGASQRELTAITRDGVKRRLSAYEAEKDALRQIYLEKSKTASTEEFEKIDKAYQESIQKVKDAKIQLQEIDADIAEQQRQSAQQQAQQATQQVSSAQQLVSLKNQIRDEEIKQIEDEKQRLQAEIVENAKRQKEEVKNTYASKTEKAKLTKLIEDNMLIDIGKLHDEYNQKEIDKEKEQAQKLADLKQQIQFNIIKAQNEFLDEIERITEENTNRTLSEQDKELRAVNDKYFRLQELAKGNLDAEKEIEIAKLNELNDINLKYQEIDQKQKDEAAKKDQERIKKLADLRLKAAKDTLETISNLTELFAGKSKEQQKKAFQVQKAVSISTALIDTYAAASKALKESPAPFNYIAMAAVITAGLLNVKKIASQKFDGGSGSGSNTAAAGGGGSAMTPQFNTIGTSGINQLATLQQQPVQAYVVSGEVTSAQSLDRNRVQNATL